MPIDRVTFAQQVKEKYPVYADIDDLALADAVLRKYPVYRNAVSAQSLQPSEGGFLPQFVKAGVNQSITGLAFQVATGEAPFKLGDFDPNLLEQIGSTVVSFVMPLDIATVLAGGGVASLPARKAGQLAVKKMVQAGVTRTVAKSAVKTGVQQAIKGGGALGAYEATASSLSQLSQTGEIDISKVAKAGLRGTTLGFLAGGTGGAIAGAGGKVIPQIAGEVAVFGTAAPLIEGRTPEAEDFAKAAGVILGLRGISAGAKRIASKKAPTPEETAEILEVEATKPAIPPETVMTRGSIDDAGRATEIYGQQRRDVKAQNSITPAKTKDFMRRNIWDVQGGPKAQIRQVKEGGPEAQKAIDDIERVAGATAEAGTQVKEAEARIYKDIRTTREEQTVNDLIQSFRTVEIETKINPKRAAARKLLSKGKEVIEETRDFITYKTKKGRTAKVEIPDRLKPVQHPYGMTLKEAQGHIDLMRSTQPERWPRYQSAVSEYFKTFQDMLQTRADEGLITRQEFNELSEFQFYSPRRFIETLDPVGPKSEGQKISVGESGIQSLKAGSESALVNDSKFLLAESISRLTGRVFRNNANKSLYEFTLKNPDNGFLEIVPDSRSGKAAPLGKTKINVMIEGQKREMLADNDFARAWLSRDPEISNKMANLIRIGSGSFILRPFATGINPAFAITNFFRDIALVWTSTDSYSKYLPVALSQYAKDFSAVIKDAATQTGRYRDYIREGGGMAFMTHQGRPFKGVTSKIPGPLKQKMTALRDYLEWFGLTSEMVTRLALRERSIKNGKTPAEATIIAKRYLDFSQGGSVIKALDNAIPYLNAQIQATRSVGRAAVENPKLFGLKMAQVSSLAVGLYLANKGNNPEAYDEIPDRQKVGNWVITTPHSWIDKNGQKRHLYISIPKDQGQRVFATIAEAAMEKKFEGKLPTKQMFQAITDFLPVGLLNKLPPSMSAYFGYVQNRDFWYNDDIWKGPEVKPSEEFTARTPEPFVKIGQATKNLPKGLQLSPERLKFALGEVFTRRNIYADLVGAFWKTVAGDVSDNDQRVLTEQLTRAPFARRLFKSTSPKVKLRDELERITIDENPRRHKQNRQLAEFVDRSKARAWIRTQSFEDRKRLFARHNRMQKTKGLPFWWYDLAELPPESRATAFFAVWSKADREEQRILRRTARRVPGISSGRFWRTFNRLNHAVK